MDELTMAEKRDLLECVQVVVRSDLLNQNDAQLIKNILNHAIFRSFQDNNGGENEDDIIKGVSNLHGN